MAAKSKDPSRYTEMRNSKALRDYFIHDKFEAGVKLSGTEVKSIRAGKAQITDARLELVVDEIVPQSLRIAKLGVAGGV